MTDADRYRTAAATWNRLGYFQLARHLSARADTMEQTKRFLSQHAPKLTYKQWLAKYSNRKETQ